MAVSNIKGANKSTPSASSFITTNSGFTVSDVEIVQQGNIVFAKFPVKSASAIVANGNARIGVLTSPYRPRIICSAGGASYRGLVATDGNVILRPYNNISANSDENVTLTLIL